MIPIPTLATLVKALGMNNVQSFAELTRTLERLGIILLFLGKSVCIHGVKWQWHRIVPDAEKVISK